VKRIHEYKRQFLNVLGVIHRYHTIRTTDPSERSNVRGPCPSAWRVHDLLLLGASAQHPVQDPSACKRCLHHL